MAAIRSFIAISLDHELRDRLGQLIGTLKASLPDRAIRWVDPLNIHLTIKFLGDVPPHKIEGIKTALSEAGAGGKRFEFGLAHLGCFPSLRRPRVVWAGVEESAGQLRALAESVEHVLASLDFAREERGFSPHVTLGRVRREVSADTLCEIGEIIQASGVGIIGRQSVDHFHLYKSDLKPSGPIYTSLARFPLGRTS